MEDETVSKKHLDLLYRRHAGDLHHANVNLLHDEIKRSTLNNRIATMLTSAYGSIYFFYVLVFGCVVWIFLQEILGRQAFDPAPYALLLLVGNFVQLFGLPILQVGQNQVAAHGELLAESDYHVNEASFKELEHQRNLLNKQSSVLLSVQSEVKEVRAHLKLVPAIDTEHALALIDSIRIDLMPIHNYIHHRIEATEQQARLMLVWHAISELALVLGSKREEETLE